MIKTKLVLIALFFLFLFNHTAAHSAQLSSLKITDFMDTKIVSANTYVEVYDFASKIGAGVIYHQQLDEYTVQIYDKNVKILFTPNNNHVIYNDSQSEMDLPTMKIDDKLYLPFIEIMRLLGYEYQIVGNELIVLKNVLDADIGDDNKIVIKLSDKADYTISEDQSKNLINITVKKVVLSGGSRTIKISNHNYIKEIALRGNSKDRTVDIAIGLNNYRKYKSYFDETSKAIIVKIFGTFKLKVFESKKIIKEVIYLDKGKPIKEFITKEEIIKDIITPEKKDGFYKLISSGRTERVSLEKIKLPDLSNEKHIKFSIMGKEVTVNAGDYYINKDKILLVPLKTIAVSLGYSIHFNPKTKEVDVTREDGKRMRLKVDFNEVGIAGADKKRVEKMRVPIRIFSNKLLVPLEDFIAVLGDGMIYGKDKTIYIGHRINEVSYEIKDNIEQVGMYCTGRIEPTKIFMLDNPLRLFINLKNAVLDVPNKEITVNRGNIIRLRMAQNENNLVRVVVDLKDKVSYGVVIDPDKKKSMIQFVPYIEKVSLMNTAISSKVYLKATQPLKYSIKKMLDPIRFEISFPDTVFKAENVVKEGQGVVYRVRSNQVLWNPLLARVVLDMAQDGDIEDILTEDKKMLILKVKPLVALVKKERKKISKPSRILSHLSDKRILIDAGHGGTDPGAISARGIMEKDLTLKTALRLQNKLSDLGAVVLMTREGDDSMSLQERVDYANKNKAEILISVHYNAHVSRGIQGTETFYFKNNDLKLASSIHKEILTLGGKNNGLRKARMYVLNHTSIPGVLIEPAYISNYSEEKLVCDPTYQDRLVSAIVEGIKKFFLRLTGKK